MVMVCRYIPRQEGKPLCKALHLQSATVAETVVVWEPPPSPLPLRQTYSLRIR